jgi:hypothetical protein
MRDAIVQRNMGMHVDLDWQAWCPAIIFINGDYYGILNIRERGNEDNIYTNHNELEDIDLFENWNNLKEGDFDNLQRFKAFYNQAGHTMAEYEQWMDCEEFINYMLLNLYHNNIDFPGNNCVMWRPKTSDGRWRWVAKDIDYSLGLYNIPYTFKIFKWFYNPNYDSTWNWGANNSEFTLLFRQLMEDQDFRDLFIERSAIYMGDFLNETGLHNVWDPMYEKIKYEYPYHRKKISKYPDYAKEMKHANDWVAHRTEEFYNQISSFYQAGNPTPLVINSYHQENLLENLSFNDVTLSEAHFDGKYFASHTIKLEAKPKDGFELMGWWIQQVNGNSTVSREYMSTDLTIKMPNCSKLIIEPICYNVANGIINVDINSQSSKANNIYDMNGRIIRSGSTSIDGLPRGVYIMKGKKILVK